MQSTLNCDWDEFKCRASQFIQIVSELNQDELTNAYNCLILSYIGLEDKEIWKSSALIVFEIATKYFTTRELELFSTHGGNNYE